MVFKGLNEHWNNITALCFTPNVSPPSLRLKNHGPIAPKRYGYSGLAETPFQTTYRVHNETGSFKSIYYDRNYYAARFGTSQLRARTANRTAEGRTSQSTELTSLSQTLSLLRSQQPHPLSHNACCNVFTVDLRGMNCSSLHAFLRKSDKLSQQYSSYQLEPRNIQDIQSLHL